jgi:hypothetical protein
MRYGTLMLAVALLLTAVVVPVDAQVSVAIGIHLPGPPALVVVPGTPVYYAPRAPENVFFYANQYWVFSNGWYVGATWNGPWALVEPSYIPQPILRVPVAYYPVPPPHWHEWRHDAPPRWDAHYGREWREEAHERNWREREARWEGPSKGCPPGLAKQGRC